MPSVTISVSFIICSSMCMMILMIILGEHLRGEDGPRPLLLHVEDVQVP